MPGAEATTDAADAPPWRALGLGSHPATLATHVLDLSPGAGIAVDDRDLRYVLADGPLLSSPGWAGVPASGTTIADLSPGVAPLLLPYYRAALAGESGALELVSPLTGWAYA